MACNCIEEMNTLLEPRNTKLGVTFSWPREGGPMTMLPALVTEKINKRNRESVLAIPSFCPFCGKSYKEGLDP